MAVMVGTAILHTSRSTGVWVIIKNFSSLVICNPPQQMLLYRLPLPVARHRFTSWLQMIPYRVLFLSMIDS